jgi:hypothetical protein
VLLPVYVFLALLAIAVRGVCGRTGTLSFPGTWPRPRPALLVPADRVTALNGRQCLESGPAGLGPVGGREICGFGGARGAPVNGRRHGCSGTCRRGGSFDGEQIRGLRTCSGRGQGREGCPAGEGRAAGNVACPVHGTDGKGMRALGDPTQGGLDRLVCLVATNSKRS